MGGAVILPSKEEVPVKTGIDDVDELQLPFDPFNPAAYTVDGVKRLALVQEKSPNIYKFWKGMHLDKFIDIVAEATIKREGIPHDQTSAFRCNQAAQDVIPISKSNMSQLEVMTEHLLALPMGAESQGKVKLIRLIKKSKLFAIPEVLSFAERIREIIEGVRIKTQTETPYMMGGSGQYISLNGSLTPEALETLEEVASDCDAMRSTLESLLFWKENQNDNIFDLFDITSSCPRFTFISHRWAAGGKALGAHNELIAMLAFAPEEYIWLDCSGAPQNAPSFENGNCLKIIWNIDVLLQFASNILTYYASTGLHVTPVPLDEHGSPVDIEDVCELSDGLLTLHQAYTASYGQIHEHYHNCIANRSLIGGNRLWCCLERTLGRDKILSITKNGFPLLSSKKTVEFKDMFVNEVGAMTSSTNITRRERAFHARLGFSLDCYASTDIEPVTTLLYKAGVLPGIFKDDSIYCTMVNEAGETEMTLGLLLPEPPYMAQMLPPKKVVHVLQIAAEYPLDVSLPNCGCTHGWKYDLASETYYFRFVWPQNPSIPELSLQVHARCLDVIKAKIWRYNGKTRMDIDFFIKFGLRRSPCVLCLDSGVFNDMWKE